MVVQLALTATMTSRSSTKGEQTDIPTERRLHRMALGALFWLLEKIVAPYVAPGLLGAWALSKSRLIEFLHSLF
jgi:hypothetical protein